MVDHVKAADLAIPEKLWKLSITEAEPAECNDIARRNPQPPPPAKPLTVARYLAALDST